MNGKIDKNSEQLLDAFFYETLNNVELLKEILAHNVDPNIKCPQTGNSPLHLAVNNRYSDYVAILLAAGASPNIGNNYEQTPLHYAATASQCQSIQLLLTAKANPNHGDNQWGCTAS